MNEKMNLFEKIQAVAQEVMSIDKDMTVGSEKYGYKAVSDINVTIKVKEAEQKYKIVSIPMRQEVLHQEIVRKMGSDGKEGLTYSFIVKMTTKIVDIENPTDFIEVETIGHGLDSGDKGFGKASTYARKYALLNAYKIATGEDPDKDKSDPQSSFPQPSEIKKSVFDLLNSDINKLQNVLGNFNKGCLDDLSESEIKKTYEAFKKKGVLK